jgi:ribonuclease T1
MGHRLAMASGGGTAAQRKEARVAATEAVDDEWKNGFYIVTGMSIELRDKVTRAIKLKG